MKNKILKILSLALSLLCALSLFVGCDALIDEETFRKALSDALSNVTMNVEYTSDGMSYERTVRSVDGKTYLQNDDGDWVETTAAQSFILVLGAISKHYADFSLENGAYCADSLHLVDDNENYTDVTDVKITFDLSCNAKSITFNEVSANGRTGTYTINLSSHGTTAVPENVVSGDEQAGGLDGSVSDDSFSSNTDNESFGGIVDDNGSFDTGNSGGEEVVTGVEIDEKKWFTAFRLDGANFSAALTMSSPSGSFTYYYRVVDGVVYYSEDMRTWEPGFIDSIMSGITPFGDRFNEFKFEEYRYHCENMDLDGNSVIDISAIFDSKGRLVELSYTLVRNGECGGAEITLYDYDSTEVPDENVDGSSENFSESGSQIEDIDPSFSLDPVR